MTILRAACHVGSAKRGSRAFSSIELLGALVFSLILSFIGIAGYRLYERNAPTRGSASQMTHAFAAARSLAISRNGTYAVRFNLTHQNFWIEETDEAGNTLVPKVTTPERLDSRIRLLDVLPKTSVEESKIRFFADGSSDNGFAYLVPESKASQPTATDYTTVRVYGPTGQSRVYENQQITP